MIFVAIAIYTSGLLAGLFAGFIAALVRGWLLRRQKLAALYRIDREFEEMVHRSILEVDVDRVG
jgi:hypothetical protein